MYLDTLSTHSGHLLSNNYHSQNFYFLLLLVMMYYMSVSLCICTKDRNMGFYEPHKVFNKIAKNSFN